MSPLGTNCNLFRWFLLIHIQTLKTYTQRNFFICFQPCNGIIWQGAPLCQQVLMACGIIFSVLLVSEVLCDHIVVSQPLLGPMCKLEHLRKFSGDTRRR